MRGAYPVWLALAGVSSFANALIFTVTAVYFVSVAGLNPLQLVLIGTVMEVAIFLAEVPTGALADTYGRRWSVAVALVLQGAAMVLVGSIASFPLFLAAYVLWGIGAAFESGALEAWVADETGRNDLEVVFLRGAQAGYCGALLGMGTSVALASRDLRLPIVAGGVLTVVLGLLLPALMPETRSRPSPDGHGSPRAAARDAFRLVRRTPILLALLAVAASFGAFTESLDRLWEAHLLVDLGLPPLGDLDPVVWFGIVGAAALLLSVAGSHVVAGRLAGRAPAATVRALLALNAVLLVAALGFALARQFAAAVAAYLVAQTARNVVAPLYVAWLNQNVGPERRATVNSIMSQGDAAGQWVGGPAIGAAATAFTLPAGLGLGALLLAPALALYAHALHRGGREL